MLENPFRKRKWHELLEKLKNRELPAEKIASAIVRLAKPFDKKKISGAKDVVASYLNHADDWVRHEAMWFLTSCGKLPEFQPNLVQALRSDPEADNRSFAASCLGTLQKGTRDPEAILALKEVVENQNEDKLVRLSCYGSLLEIAKNESGLDFSIYKKDLPDIDWEWINSLPQRTP